MKARDRLHHPSERHDFELAMEAAKGLPAHVVVRIANRAQHGVDFSGSSKGDVMAHFISDGGLDRERNNRVHGGTDVWTLREEWWPKFLDDLRKTERPPTPKQRKAAKQAAEEKELRERQAEAKGWTIKRVEKRLSTVEARRAKLRNELHELTRERAKLHRIGKTLSPRWALDNFI